MARKAAFFKPKRAASPGFPPGAEPVQTELAFSDISPKLKLNISDRAKRMALRLDPRHRVVHLVVPKRASLRAAYDFAEEHQTWIREKIRDLPRPVLLSDGAILPILGRERQVIILFNEALRATDIQLKKDELIVMTNQRDPSLRIRRFLMDLAKKRIAEMAEEKATLLRRRIVDIQVKDTRSRWGSCSDDGRLCFSWRLIFAPLKALDYVVAHEVAHLVHMDHSESFWRVCEKASKDYDFGRKWMRDHGHELMRFGSV